MQEVVAVCISEMRGTKKTQVPYIDVKKGHGIVGDAHAGSWHRQISLLAKESVDKMADFGLDLKPGVFAENILTKGIVLNKLPVDTLLKVGDAVLRVTQIGKKCHNDCEIKRLTGKCVMPTEGIFAEVVTDGSIRAGDTITICEDLYETN